MHTTTMRTHSTITHLTCFMARQSPSNVKKFYTKNPSAFLGRKVPHENTEGRFISVCVIEIIFSVI
ncbi:MAG: hypothetical protein SPL10_05925 [Synergistales bacterium]|nr:hypothetical protein [Synergistales bacterium]MDY6401501.1 hypothetical protein [Synergistales bacterium]MDY6404608.1 hypothetical protein [Synergistales bacterium]MDY6410511.1 hypothetical protein [Synergistales bacterium]MDY6414684.1 hypothetical protein [Synergistales bacterium]